jgi:hypothetical protein
MNTSILKKTTFHKKNGNNSAIGASKFLAIGAFLKI